MNRELIARIAIVAVAAIGGSTSPALAKDPPKPSLSIDPIVARNLLAPIDEARADPPAYRLDPGRDLAAGSRARLSVDVGDATLFAITGRLTRQPVPFGPLDPSHAGVLGQRRDSGKVYGGGVSRTFRGVDLSATYQYSKVTAGQPELETDARDSGMGKSHSVRATARIRFKP